MRGGAAYAAGARGSGRVCLTVSNLILFGRQPQRRGTPPHDMAAMESPCRAANVNVNVNVKAAPLLVSAAPERCPGPLREAAAGAPGGRRPQHSEPELAGAWRGVEDQLFFNILLPFYSTIIWGLKWILNQNSSRKCSRSGL